MGNIKLQDLIINVEEILNRESIDTVVELKDLGEITYSQLNKLFKEKDYEVKGVITILENNFDNISHCFNKYTLHISRRKNA